MQNHCKLLTYKLGGNNTVEKTNTTDEDDETEDDETEDEEDDDSNCVLPFDIPVEGVNHTLEFTLGVEWDDFQWEVSQKLHVHPTDVKLSYKLASQPKAEMERALVDEKDLADLIRRSRPFVNGTKKCARGKEFSVQLYPKIAVSKSMDGEKPTPTQKKVCLCSQGLNFANWTNRPRRNQRRGRRLEQAIPMRVTASRRRIPLTRSPPHSRSKQCVTRILGRAVLSKIRNMYVSSLGISLNGQR